jgi:hypothetical protein
MNRHQYARALTAVYAKFAEADHPRDESGQFTSELSFVPHQNSYPETHTTVMADAEKLDKEWSKDAGFYLPKEGLGKSENKGKRQDFEDFLKKGEPIRQPKVVVDANGDISFEDGRHRTRVLLNKGLKRIPLTVHKDDAERVRELVGVE